jgi:hypothetical protein
MEAPGHQRRRAAKLGLARMSLAALTTWPSGAEGVLAWLTIFSSRKLNKLRPRASDAQLSIKLAAWNLHYLSDAHAIVPPTQKLAWSPLLWEVSAGGRDAGGRRRFYAHVPPPSAGSALAVPSRARGHDRLPKSSPYCHIQPCELRGL